MSRTRGMLSAEAGVWRALATWSRTGRPDDAVRFGYGSQIRIILIAILVIAVVEGIVVDAIVGLITDSLIWAAVVALVHVYALCWILGILASLRTRPHEITGDAVILRDLVFAEHAIPRENIESVSARRTANTSRSGMTVDAVARSALLAHGDATVRLHLVGHVIDDAPVDHIDITVDRPTAFVEHLTAVT